MELVLAGVRIPAPYGGVMAARYGLDVARSGVRWARGTAVLAFELPGRIDALLDDVEALMVRINSVVDSAQEVVAEVDKTNTSADEIVASAGLTSRTALELVELIDPIARRTIPIGRKFVDHLEDDEIDAAIEMVNHLPQLVQHMEATIPILATLESVAPEMHELLNVTKDVRRAVIGIPGFKFFRNRGQVKLDDEEDLG